MFSKERSILVLLFLLFSIAAAAVELNVSVQPEDITVGMRGAITISARDVNDLMPGRNPGDVPGIEWEGISRGSSLKMINGAVSNECFLSFSFTAMKEGEITVPPLELVVIDRSRKQERVKTEPVKFKIFKAPKVGAALAKSNAPVYADMTFPGSDGDAPASFWVGEEIPVRISFYVRSQLGFRLAAYPEILSASDQINILARLSRKNNSGTPDRTVQFGGIQYDVYDYGAGICALSPGELQLISKADVILTEHSRFDPFGTSVRRSVRGASPAVTIKPLPAPPGDAPFTGLVGKWKTEASVTPGPYTVGTPLRLEITFKGKSRADHLKLPDFEPAHFRVFPPEVDKTDSGAAARFILIPVENGKQDLSFGFSTFDPESGKYVPFLFRQTLEVAGDPADVPVSGADNAANKPSVRDPARDDDPVADAEVGLHYLHDEGRGGLVTIPLVMNDVWIPLGLLFVGLVYAGGSAFVCIRRRVLENDPSARRRINARARRGALASSIEKTPPQELPDKVGADLALFFNDMLDLPPGTALSETAAFVKENAPELGGQLEDLANTAWMPSLRDGLDENFRSRLASAVRKFGVFAAVLAVLCLAVPARTAAAEETQPQAGSAANAAESAPSEITVDAASIPKNAEEAKAAYDAGQFRRALDYYVSKIDPRHVSPALLYNMGNCFYQLGDYPRALICYERARRLQPRNADISGNLELTRSKLGLPPKYDIESPADFLAAVRDFLRMDEWLVVCAFGLTLLLIALGLFVRRKTNLWQWPFYAGIVVTLVCAAALIAKISADDPAREAVVIVPDAPLYSLPAADPGREKQRLSAGTEVLLEEKRADWIRVRLENGSEGWVRPQNLALLWSNSPGDIATRPDAAP